MGVNCLQLPHTCAPYNSTESINISNSFTNSSPLSSPTATLHLLIQSLRALTPAFALSSTILASVASSAPDCHTSTTPLLLYGTPFYTELTPLKTMLASLNPLHSFLNQTLLHHPQYFLINLIYCLLVLSSPPQPISQSVNSLHFVLQIACWVPKSHLFHVLVTFSLFPHHPIYRHLPLNCKKMFINTSPR